MTLRAAALTLALALAQAGCAAEVNPLRGVAEATGFATKPKDTSDFVTQSRPADSSFMPIGTPQQARPTPAKSKDEVKKIEQSLEATRTNNEVAGKSAQAAGQTPAPTPNATPPPEAGTE